MADFAPGAAFLQAQTNIVFAGEVLEKIYMGGWPLISVGIDLKELGGQMSKCLKFCPGIEILNRFSLKNECL